MKRQALLHQFGLLSVAATALLLIANVQAFAQKTDYKPGEQIEYFDHYTNTWEIGVFVEKSYDGSQPVIRTKPSQYFPQGEQKALADWSQIRPLQAQPQNNQADENRNPAKDEKPVEQTPIKTTGEGLMSQADVLNFLKTNLGANPFANPKRDEIKAQLAEEIKRRGLNFHFQTVSDFFNQLAAYGAITQDVIAPLKDNYGAPTKQNWLMGAWNLDNVVNTEVIMGAKGTGKLTINPGGTYVWYDAVYNKTYRGRWRKATKEEMQTQGGDGLVLLKAKGDWDWIVTQNRTWTKAGDVIWVSELKGRTDRETGSRGGK
jgi:hypothetical protein